MRVVLLIGYALAALGQEAPLLVLLPGGANPWTPQVADRGWELAVVPSATPDDAGVRAIEGAVQEARKRRAIDTARIYLAGQNTATVFYAVSRRPDMWAGALALGGSPKAAVDSNRLFGANAQLVPLLWLTNPQDRALADPLRAKLRAAGFDLEPQPAGITPQQALDWLGTQKRDAFPQKVDCETGSLEFGRCYWVEVRKIDPARRNDVLPSTRVAPGAGAVLALGGFGFNPDAPGPGLLVGWLPDNYKGPLKLQDRIVAISGKEVRDGRQYVETMDQVQEEKRVGVIILRGKERLRVESRIVLPKREENVTARVQAQFLTDPRELLVITRGIAELRVSLPSYWVPCPINWNGNDMGQAEIAGCWALGETGKARRCE